MLTPPPEYAQAGNLMIASGGLKVLAVVYCFVPVCWMGLPFIVGIGAWEVMMGLKVRKGQPIHNAAMVCYTGLAAGICSGNIFSCAAAVLGLSVMKKPQVTEWLEAALSAPTPAQE